MEDLIVNDSDYERMGDAYISIGAYFEEIITEYCSIIDNICINGIIKGNVHDNLQTFKQMASVLSGQVETATKIVAQVCEDFVDDIDDADEDLY